MPRNESPGDFLVPEVAHRTLEKTFVSPSKSLVGLDKDSYNLGFLMCFHLLRSVLLCQTTETWHEELKIAWALLNYCPDQNLISTRCRRKSTFITHHHSLACMCTLGLEVFYSLFLLATETIFCLLNWKSPTCLKNWIVTLSIKQWCLSNLSKSKQTRVISQDEVSCLNVHS